MTRIQQLLAVTGLLYELTTDEEREDYPFLKPLNDLIKDKEFEED